MVAVVYSPGQLPLIEFIESDELFLQDEPQALWFDVLRKLDYRQFQPVAARYYEQLWQFNHQQTQDRLERQEHPPAANPETQAQATARLLFGRATLDEQTPVLYRPPPRPTPAFTIRPETLHPGVTPPRFAGRLPKCFFALFKAFLGVTLAGQPAEPQFVDQKLRENPAFARTCGFTIPRAGKPERASDIPSLRKLQQFDQIMTQNGLWGEAALDRVAANLRDGTVHVPIGCPPQATASTANHTSPPEKDSCTLAERTPFSGQHPLHLHAATECRSGASSRAPRRSPSALRFVPRRHQNGDL